jgi:ABC-type polar amino acid transport system ATPase subunit
VIEAPMQVLGLSQGAATERGKQLLDRVGLSDKLNERPERLSGGQQQRVAIARALAMQPRAILFDEPTSALDPRMTAEVLSVLTDLAAAGQTMVVVTHAMSFARRAASRVHVFQDGAVLESGPPQQIFEHPKEPGTAAFLREREH